MHTVVEQLTMPVVEARLLLTKMLEEDLNFSRSIERQEFRGFEGFITLLLKSDPVIATEFIWESKRRLFWRS